MKRLQAPRGYLAKHVNWLLALLLIMVLAQPDASYRNGRVAITLGPPEAYAAGTADYSLDGLADDVEVLAALNALPNQGGLLHFKAGTYNLTANVTRAIGNVTIEGEGRNTLFTGSGSFVAGGNQWVFRDLALNATTQVDMGATTGWEWANVYDQATLWNSRVQSGQVVFATANISTLNFNGTLIAATGAELNYLVGATSNVQAQLNLRAPLASPTFTGTVTLPATTMGGDISFAGYNILAANTWQSSTGYPIWIYSKRTNADEAFRLETTGVTPVFADTLRLSISGRANTAVATWTNVTQTWSFYGAGTLVTDANGVVTASSDARLKNVTGPSSRGLKSILKLSPVEFQWKSFGTVNSTSNESRNDNKNVYVGLIAQDVAKYIPEAVGIAPDGYYTLSDRALIAALINSVKELQAQLDQLRIFAGLAPYETNLAVEDDKKIIRRKD